MKQITAEEFKQKINSNEKLIVDFYADWCSPCKMMMPIVEEVNNKVDIEFYKFNIESDRDLVVSLGIRGVPTIKAFNQGKEVFSKSGIMREQELINLSESVLNG